MVMRILLTIMLLLPFQIGWAVTPFHAEVDRSTIAEGESFTLTLRYNDSVLSGNPDFAPLLEDFKVRSHGRKTSFQLMNGQSEFWTIWTLTLTPKRLGPHTIPSVKFKDSKTQAINVEVAKLSAKIKEQRNKELFFHTEVDTKTAYVQGQVLYTERLYFSVPIENGTLSDVNVDEAVVEPLGNTKHYRTQLQGRTFDVYERKFAIFPQVSGEMIIPGPIYNGEVGNRRFGGGRAVSASHPPTRVAVNPKPARYPSADAWLPAKELSLDYRWLGDPTNIRVGDPITLEVTLRAHGLNSAQLPEITIDNRNGLKVYPEQAQTNNQTDDAGFIGFRRQSFALVTTRNGSVTLPEIRIPWWDTQNQQLRYAVLPSQRITATGAANQPTEDNKPVATEPAKPISAEDEDTTVALPTHQQGEAADTTVWRWAALAFAILWLITLSAWWRLRLIPKPVAVVNVQEEKELNGRQWYGQLKSACRKQDPKQAREALLQWMSHLHGRPITQLSQLIAEISDNSLKQAIETLDQTLYGSSSSNRWQGEYLWQLIKGWRPEFNRAPQHTQHLYPNEAKA